MSKSQSIRVFQSNGLGQKNSNYRCLYFLNADTGFLGGSLVKISHPKDMPNGQFAVAQREAVLFNTVDGGRNWAEKVFGRGTIESIRVSGNYMYLILLNEESSIVYKSDDRGKNWIDSLSFPGVVNYFYETEEKRFIIGRIDRKEYRLYSQNKLEKGLWKAVDTPLPIGKVCESDSNLFFYTNNDVESGNKNVIVKYATKDETLDSVILPKGVEFHNIISENSEVKLIGTNVDSIIIYSFDKHTQFNIEAAYRRPNECLPLTFLSLKKQTYVLYNDLNSVSNFLVQLDHGGKARTIDFAFSSTIRPYFLLNNNGVVKGWFYSQSGLFQILQ